MALMSTAATRGSSTETEFGVAFVCQPYHRGGVTRWMVDAAAEFRRRGTPVWFIAPEPIRPFPSSESRPTMASLIRGLPQATQPKLIAPLVGVSFELGTAAYRKAVYACCIARSVPAGTAIIVSDDSAVWSAAAALSGSHPMIGVLHSDEPKYYAIARKHRHRVAGCVAVSQRIARIGAECAGVDCDCIPCGVPLREVFPEKVSADGSSQLIWIGRIEESQKRVSDLPAIAEDLLARGVRFMLTIVGDGPERDELMRTIRGRGLDEFVKLVGWKDSEAIWSYLKTSDVLVLPSNFEGMPIVVMEALSAGCFVVASQVSGIEDVDEHGYVGRPLRTYRRGDVRDAAALIADALEVSRHDRITQARAMASELFAIGVCIDRYEDMLVKIRPRFTGISIRTPSTLTHALVSFPIACARALRRSVRSSLHK